MRNDAETSLEINHLIKERWSPRGFSDKKVDKEQLRLMFEAARWAPSSFNEQPWRFLVGMKGEGETYNRILQSLNEGNRQWAQQAPILGVVIAKTTFSQNGKMNQHAAYDAGQAMAYLTLQATEASLSVHQMAGFNPAFINEKFNIPSDFQVLTAFAIGYSEVSEIKKRIRKSLSETVFSEGWRQSLFI